MFWLLLSGWHCDWQAGTITVLSGLSRNCSGVIGKISIAGHLSILNDLVQARFGCRWIPSG